MRFDKANSGRYALDEQDPQSAATAAMADFLSALGREMDDGDVIEISAAPAQPRVA
jgi:hypothetical protein